MKNVLLTWYTLLKDAVFPVFCFGCKKEGILLCETCYKTIDTHGVYVCPVCHVEVPSGKPCFACRELTPLIAHSAVGIFKEDNLLGKLIHAYKYNFITDAGFIFEKLIADFLEKNKHQFSDVQMIVPVPLHRRRLAERGFNQAEEIGKIVVRQLNLPMQNILQRKIFTQQQAKLGKQERQENIKNAFQIKKETDVSGKNVLLVDDVFTTGSTLGECARVLKQNGAGDVSAFTLVRG